MGETLTPQQEAREPVEPYRDLAEIHRFLKEHNAIGLLIGGKLFALARGAAPQELAARKDADIFLLKRGGVSKSDEYDVFAPNPQRGTVENQNGFVLPYSIHYQGEEPLAAGLHIPPMEITRLLLLEQESRRPSEKSLAQEHPLAYRNSSFPPDVKELQKEEVLVEFPGDISWLQKETAQKTAPAHHIYTTEEGTHFVSFADKDIGQNELPQPAFRDLRNIRRPERGELDKELFPEPDLNQQKEIAHLLIEKGFVLEGLRKLLEVDPLSLDSQKVVNAITQKIDQYPHSCALALSEWLRAAIDNKFLSLLQFCDLDCGDSATYEREGVKKFQNFFDKIAELLIEQYGETYADMAARLKGFSRGFESKLFNRQELIRKHSDDLSITFNWEISPRNLWLQLQYQNETLMKIPFLFSLAKNTNEFIKVLSENEKLREQLQEGFSGLNNDDVIKRIRTCKNIQENRTFIETFHIRGEQLLKQLNIPYVLGRERDYDGIVIFLQSFEEKNILPLFKAKFLQELVAPAFLQKMQEEILYLRDHDAKTYSSMQKFLSLIDVVEQVILNRRVKLPKPAREK